MFTPSNHNQRRRIHDILRIYEFAANSVTNKNVSKMETNNKTNETNETTEFSFASTFNKQTFDVDTTEFEFCKLGELYTDKGAIYRLDGLWINRSQLGEQGVLIVSELGKLVNAPMHYTDTLRNILASTQAVDAIKRGKVGFTVYEYESHARKCYGIKFVDLVNANAAQA